MKFLALTKRNSYFIPVTQLAQCYLLLSYWQSCFTIFGACSARCSGWLGCVLATGSGLTWRRGPWWQYKVSKWDSPLAGTSWEMALHCRFGHVCHGSFVIQHTSAPSVMGLVDREWEELGWQQGEGDVQWKSLWALLGTNVTQWADLKGFKGRKWRGVSLNSSATECKNWC